MTLRRQLTGVPCERCGEPTSITMAVLRANHATTVVCARCLSHPDESADTPIKAGEQVVGP